jgi:hypothetical protein
MGYESSNCQALHSHAYISVFIKSGTKLKTSTSASKAQLQQKKLIKVYKEVGIDSFTMIMFIYFAAIFMPLWSSGLASAFRS